MIQFKCGCGTAYSLKDELAGKPIRCGKCQAVSKAPSAGIALAPPPPAPTPAPPVPPPAPAPMPHREAWEGPPPPTTMKCPACGFEQPKTNTDCAQCQVVMAKFLQKKKSAPSVGAAAAASAAAPPAADAPATGTKKGAGILMALAVLQVIAFGLIAALAGSNPQLQRMQAGCMAAAVIFGAFSAGAYAGYSIFVWLGLGVIVLDFAYALMTNPSMAFKGIILKVYFINALYKAATEES